MKWSELTWKERKQIYDTVRADNPNVSYLDIKQQFDNIPEYENGKEGNPKLPIEYAVPLTIADLANANNTNNN